MSRIDIISGANQPFNSPGRMRRAFQAADDNFEELYGHFHLSWNIPLHASKVIYNLLVARRALEITHIDYVPDIAQGGALTATLVKAVGTATPASATTPMHTAAAINLNGTAHTVQSITLSLIQANLQLANSNRMALVLSGAMTVGSGVLSVRGKLI